MKNVKKIKRRRKFSNDFKKRIVNEFTSKKFSVLELSRLHSIGQGTIYNWIYKYSTIKSPNSVIVEMKDSSTNKLKAYEKKIKELERIVGQKQIEIDYLSKIIDFANEHYQTDLKKTSSMKSFGGLNKSDKK